MSDSTESIGALPHSNAITAAADRPATEPTLPLCTVGALSTANRAAGALLVQRTWRLWAGCLCVTFAACAKPPPPPPPPRPALFHLERITSIAPYPFSRVYTAEAGVSIRGDSTEHPPLRRAFVPLNVLGRDSLGLVVRCQPCEPPLDGRVAEDEVVHGSPNLGVAAFGSLGEFALAVSAAAKARDVDALRDVMAPDFFFSFVGSQTPDAAIAVWQSEDYAALALVPELLSEGLGTVDGKIWAAPREYVENLGYRGLRLGFRKRADGRWEWLYLVRGIAE